jgi:hypothetical protein
MKRFAGSLVGFGILCVLFAAGEARATIPSCLTFTGYVYLQGEETPPDTKNVVKSKVLKVRLGTKEILALLHDVVGGPTFPKGVCIEVDPHEDGTTTVRVKTKDNSFSLDVTAQLSFLFDFAFGEFFNGTYDFDTEKEKSTILFPIDISVNTPDAHFDVSGMGTEQFNAAAIKEATQTQSISGSIKSRVVGTGTVADLPALLEGTVSLMGRGIF